MISVKSASEDNCQKCLTAIRDRGGCIITTDLEQVASWIELYKSVLNQPFPQNTVALTTAPKDLEINENLPMVREAADAIRSLINCKLTSNDVVHAEMLKFGLPTNAGVLCSFFNEVWE